MPILKAPVEKNLWDSICEEFEKKKQTPIVDDKNEYIAEFNSEKHNPVFYNQAFNKNSADDDKLLDTFDPSVSHPACVGYYIESFKKDVKLEKSARPVLNIDKCTKREYLEEF